MSEVDLKKMVTIVFSNPPSDPKTYKLDLSVDDSLEMNETVVSELAKTTSNVLINIFISGCNILYGNEVTPANISQDQFQYINKYIKSFGYETHYEYTYNEEQKPTNLNVYFTALE